MNNKLLILNMLVFISLIVSCGTDKNSSNESREPEENQSFSFENKSSQEILKMKYKRADFVCDLWIQNQKVLDKKNGPGPVDSFSWDLINDFSEVKDMELRFSNQYHMFEVDVKINNIEFLGSLNYTDADGTTYKGVYTPSLDVEFNHYFQSRPSNKVSMKGSGSRNYDVYEKIKSVIISESYGFDSFPGMIFYNHLECFIDTELRPEFKNHFKKIEED